MTQEFYAHSCDGAPASTWQLLRDHLRSVAALARSFAGEVRPEERAFAEAAYWAGLLHDVGKYRGEFQHLLCGGPKSEETRHKQAGAACAFNAKRPDLAFAIAGHHGGLPDVAELKELMYGKGKGNAVFQQIQSEAVADCPELRQTPPPWVQSADPFLLDLVTRFLFSCLVDADWRDTGDFYRQEQGLPLFPDAPAIQARETPQSGATSEAKPVGVLPAARDGAIAA